MNKKIKIYYFTGTGNSLSICNYLKNFFIESKNIVSIESLTIQTQINTTGFDIVGFIMPVAVHSAYPFIWKKLANLEKAQNQTGIFLITTLGGTHSGLPYTFKKIIEKQGYSAISYLEIRMPHNFFGLKLDTKSKNDVIQETKSIVYKFGLAIEEGKAKWNRKWMLDDLFNTSANSTWMWNMMRFFYPFKIKEEKCIKCGICIKLCPVTNIVLNDRAYPEIKNNCQICMRCITYCPKDAIVCKNKKQPEYKFIEAADLLSYERHEQSDS